MNVFHCQYCYECVDCWNCYQCCFSQLCRDSSDLAFCYDCIGCRNCFGSVGLRNAEYYFFNKKCTQVEYESLIQQYALSTFSGLEYIKKYVTEMIAGQPRRALYHMNAHNARGDYIVESKDVELSFDVEKSDTVRYSWGVEYAKDVVDGDFIYYGERCFNSISNSKSSNCDFCFAMLGGNYDCTYCMLLFNNSHDCFGCISLKKGSYSILNKQYAKEEYEKLVPRIIKQMKEAGRAHGASASKAKDLALPGLSRSELTYGQFFPPELSCFGYNETVASIYFPLSKDEALKKGFNWYDGEPKQHNSIHDQIPDALADVSDIILDEVLSCIECGKNYKIVIKELQFYRNFNLPIPRSCYLCRHKRRVAQRNPRKLWPRSCDSCAKSIESSYAPDRPEKIYCEACYTKALY